MRQFFEIDQNQNLVINPDLYSIKVFRKIYNRDRSISKENAIKDLSYIFWMCDFRSYIADITDINDKSREAISLIDDTGKYKPDKLVQEAIDVYRKDVPISLLFLEDVKVAVNELRKYFRELDLTLTDDKGKPLHNANQVMNSIKATGDLLETLEKHEIKVKKDLDMNSSVRGGGEKGMYED